MKKLRCLSLAALAASSLTAAAQADAIAEPTAAIPDGAGLWLLILLIALVVVTLCMASKHGGKRK